MFVPSISPILGYSFNSCNFFSSTHVNRADNRTSPKWRFFENPPSNTLIITSISHRELCHSRYLLFFRFHLGLGTVIASWTDVEYEGWDWAVFITGIIQFGLAWIIIGWAWSIWWGVRMFQDAQERKKREEEAAETRTEEHTSLTQDPPAEEQPLSVHVSTDNPENTIYQTMYLSLFETHKSRYFISIANRENQSQIYSSHSTEQKNSCAPFFKAIT